MLDREHGRHGRARRPLPEAAAGEGQLSMPDPLTAATPLARFRGSFAAHLRHGTVGAVWITA